MRYYNLSEKEVFSALSTSPNGLSESEAKKRLEKYGLNELKEKKKTSAFSIFLRQFNSFIVLILVAAVILSILVNEYIDAIVIAIVLALNSTLGFVQEYKAERSMEAL
ncbi:ATPase, partial [Candidatus Woesearchaeota archaeon]|nr:ATPase [Candidatus Woesearchaeota archaeon]